MLMPIFSAEDANGPAATCELVTFDPEPGLELPFDADQT
jgi:cell cycle checkpoint protein